MKLVKRSAFLCWVIQVVCGHISSSGLKQRKRLASISNENARFGSNLPIQELTSDEFNVDSMYFQRFLEDAMMSIVTDRPSARPTNVPTRQPTKVPTRQPTTEPTNRPSK